MSTDLVRPAPDDDLPVPKSWRMKARFEEYSYDKRSVWFNVWEGKKHITSLGEIDLAVFTVLEMARERAAEAQMPYSPVWASSADIAHVANEFKTVDERPVNSGYVSLSLLGRRSKNEGWVQSDTRGVKIAVWRLTKRGHWALRRMRSEMGALERRAATQRISA